MSVKQTQILAIGFTGVEIANFIPEKQKFSRAQMSEIQERWNEQKRKAGKNLWNNSMASVVSFSIDAFGRLELVLRKSDYKTYVGTRKERFINTDDMSMDENYSLPISMGAVTITSDDFIVLGLRSETEAHRDKLAVVPSGYFDPSVHYIRTEAGKILSIEVLILSELYEELGIQTYSSKIYLALIQDIQPMIAMKLEIPYTKREMEQIAKINFEHSKFIYIENTVEAVEKALIKYEFTPHTLATLRCHFIFQKEAKNFMG